MSKLEEKLIELGYKGLAGYNGEIHFSKFPTKYTCITIITKDGKYLKSIYEPIARMIPKYESNMRQAFYQLQKDLEVLKECQD